MRQMNRSQRSASLRLLLIAPLVVFGLAAAAQADKRIRLDRETAEFSAYFFATIHGAPLGEEAHINCRKRLGLNSRRCRVSWETRRYASRARLLLAAFEGASTSNTYRVRYTLRRVDRLCAGTMPAEECTTTERGRETYTGS